MLSVWVGTYKLMNLWIIRKKTHFFREYHQAIYEYDGLITGSSSQTRPLARAKNICCSEMGFQYERTQPETNIRFS
jgi:hypothetical protein